MWLNAKWKKNTLNTYGPKKKKIDYKLSITTLIGFKCRIKWKRIIARVPSYYHV